MVVRPVSALAVVVLLAASSLAVVGAAGEGLQAVEVERFSGRGLWTIGLDAGPAASPTIHAPPPQGNLTVPERSTSVIVEANWSHDAPGSPELRLSICDRPCLDGDGRVLAHAEAASGVRLRLPLDRSRIHWHVSADHGTAANVTVEGRAVFLAPDPQPVESTVAASGMRASNGPDEGVGADAIAWAVLTASVVGVAGWLLHRTSPLSGLALYHRLDRDELLDHPLRARIYEILDGDPGIHFRELQRRTEVARGTLEHHLRHLLDADLVEEERVSSYRCFFRTGDLPTDLKTALGRIRDPKGLRILTYLAANPCSRLKDVREATGIPRSTVGYQLDVLEETGLVRREEHGRAVSLSTTSLAEEALQRLGLRR